MINIYDISSGWASLQIGYCVFVVSYLSDVKAELDTLLLNLDIEEEHGVRKIILDGEDIGELVLISHLTFEDTNVYLSTDKQHDYPNYDWVLNIIWQRTYCADANSFTIMKFPYKEFIKEYKALTKKIKIDYLKKFICPCDVEEYLNAAAAYDAREGNKHE